MKPIQKLQLYLTGKVFVGHRKRPGWSGSIPFYAFRCSIHGIVEDYPHGFDSILSCPICVQESLKGKDVHKTIPTADKEIQN